ncbi:MAG: hypothetical protein R3C68_03465 [Myxococcota bacterium]
MFRWALFAGVTIFMGGLSTSAAVINSPFVDLDNQARSYGVSAGLNHSIGTGTFVRNNHVREQSDRIVQIYDFSAFYRFDIRGHRLKLRPSFAFAYELTRPNSNPSRRFLPGDLRLSMIDEEIYRIPKVDIPMSSSVSWSVPTSLDSRRVSRMYGSLSGRVGLSRKFSHLSLYYAFGATKFFNAAKVKTSRSVFARDTDAAAISSPGFPASNTTDPVLIDMGFANNSFALAQTLGVSYEFLPDLRVDYTLSIVNGFKYKLERADTIESNGQSIIVDQAQVADGGRGRSDVWAPTLSVSYALNNALDKVFTVPLQLILSAGLSAAHPIKSADNGDFILPFFYDSFAQNRAANNYGSFFVKIMGIY